MQWESIRQRRNYYKLYCFWWAKRFVGGITMSIAFQALYGPHFTEHLLYRKNPFLDSIEHEKHLYLHQAMRVKMPLLGDDDET